MVEIPAHIPRPDYADTGRPGRHRLSPVKNAEQISGMRASCGLARRILDQLCAAAKVGMTTDELDCLATELCLKHECYPSTLNYHGYPKSICTSINEVICHGIPDSRPLVDGDIVNIDITVFYQGFHGDCSETVLIGQVDEAGRRLVETTRRCLAAGVQAVKPGGQLRDIGTAIESIAKPAGYSVVEAFVGHGIGEVFHMDPQVPHYYDRSNTFEFKPGMTFTIEPMINEGVMRHRVWPDDWTAVTLTSSGLPNLNIPSW